MYGRGRIWCVWILLLLATSGSVQAQAPQYVFKISFKDKAGAPPLSSASSFLSQRALDRRTAQDIALDSTDRPVSPGYVSDVLSTTGGTFHVKSKWLNFLVILLTDSSKILTLSGKPYIQSIEYTGYYDPYLHNKTSNGGINQNAQVTGSSNYYGSSWNQTDMVHGDYLHDRGFKGQGKLIAVLDAGFVGVDIGLGFDSLVQSGRIVDAYDLVHASTDVYSYSGHGTGCLSTMAAYLPGTYVGTAPLAEYALYCTEVEGIDQPAEMDNMVAGIERADSVGADIISSSLGYNNFQGPGYSTLTYADIDGKTTAPAKAVNLATAKGMLCVISAGNEGGNPWNYILTPGDADSAITVGSVNINKDPAGDSGFGPNSAGRIKPDVCLLGSSAYIMQTSGTPVPGNGTSYATPQLAGWAACLWQATSNTTPWKLRNAITQSAHRYLNPGAQLGYGIPDFGKAFELMGIKDVAADLNTDNWLKAYPNPFYKQLTIGFYMDTNEKADIAVFDITGRKVAASALQLNKGVQTATIDLPGLPAGTYYLKAVTETKNTTIALSHR